MECDIHDLLVSLQTDDVVHVVLYGNCLLGMLV